MGEKLHSNRWCPSAVTRIMGKWQSKSKIIYLVLFKMARLLEENIFQNDLFYSRVNSQTDLDFDLALNFYDQNFVNILDENIEQKLFGFVNIEVSMVNPIGLVRRKRS